MVELYSGFDMKQVEPSMVRKHFFFCQESKETPTDELDRLKEKINNLSDEEIKQRINSPHNECFKQDDAKWFYEELEISETHCQYSELQGMELKSGKGMNYSEIARYLREKDNAGYRDEILDKIKAGDIERVKKLLPIFVVVKEDGLKYVHDGQSRIATLAFHGISKVSAYVYYGKNSVTGKKVYIPQALQ